MAIWIFKKRFAHFSRAQWEEIYPHVVAFEPLADKALAELDLCDAILDFFPAGTFEWRHSASWWERVLIEDKLYQFFLTFNQMNANEVNENNSDFVGQLNKNKNPLSPSHLPSIYNLLDATLLILNKEPKTFRKVEVEKQNSLKAIYHRYLKSLKKWNRFLKKPTSTHRAIHICNKPEGLIIRQAQKNQPKEILITPNKILPLSRQGNKKRGFGKNLFP